MHVRESFDECAARASLTDLIRAQHVYMLPASVLIRVHSYLARI
jgi:hypothetical protein